MNRRDFFLLATRRGRRLDVSCERLYMKYVDARLDGTSDELLQRVLEALQQATRIRLHQPFWLDREELRTALDPLLREVRARGARIEYV